MGDAATGKLLHDLTPSEAIQSAAFLRDGRRILAGGGKDSGKLWLWNVTSAQVERSFSGPDKPVRSIAISPDDSQFLSAGDDKVVTLWDSASGNRLRTFEGHAAGIGQVAFSPDGKLALSGSDDHNAALWDVSTGRLLRSFVGHAGAVTGVAFLPDGARAFSANRDGALRLWMVSTGELLVTFIAAKGEWIAFTSEGFFEASSKGTGLATFVRGLKVVEPSSTALHRPDLVAEKMLGDPSGKVKAAAKRVVFD